MFQTHSCVALRCFALDASACIHVVVAAAVVVVVVVVVADIALLQHVHTYMVVVAATYSLLSSSVSVYRYVYVDVCTTQPRGGGSKFNTPVEVRPLRALSDVLSTPKSTPPPAVPARRRKTDSVSEPGRNLKRSQTPRDLSRDAALKRKEAEVVSSAVNEFVQSCQPFTVVARKLARQNVVGDVRAHTDGNTAIIISWVVSLSLFFLWTAGN